MPIQIQTEAPNLCVMRTTGVLHKADMKPMEDVMATIIEQTGGAKILVLLDDDFCGLARGAEWGDVTSFSYRGDKVLKMAIVGDLKWESEVMVLAGAGRRRAPVRMFDAGQEAEARAWLSAT
jgi:hypothetical protein